MVSLFVLMISLVIQSIILLPVVFQKKPADLIYMVRQPLLPLMLGAVAGINSFLWFYAFSLTYVAYVSTVTQLHLVVSILFSVYYFREKIYRNEVVGMMIMIAGIVLLIFA